MKPEDLDIRPALPAEATVVHRIVQAAFAEYAGVVPIPPEAQSETLTQVAQEIATGQVVLAWDGTDAVGTVRYALYPDCLYVRRLAVLPAQRGRGIGAALMGYLEMLAPHLDRTAVRLSTRQSMPGNLAFYRQLGYRITKTEPLAQGADSMVWFAKHV